MLIHARIMHQLKGCKEDFFTNEDILKEQVDFINKHLAEASHKWIPNNNDFLVFLFESTDIICIIEDSTVYKSGNISTTILQLKVKSKTWSKSKKFWKIIIINNFTNLYLYFSSIYILEGLSILVPICTF